MVKYLEDETESVPVQQRESVIVTLREIAIIEDDAFRVDRFDAGDEIEKSSVNKPI